MSEIKMLPLPEDAVEWLRQYGVANTAFQMEVIEGWFQAHALAVAEHNVTARDVEIEALRAEVARRIEAFADRAEQLEARAERLAEALQWYAEQAALCRKLGADGDKGRQALDADGGKRAYAALRDHDQEGKDG